MKKAIDILSEAKKGGIHIVLNENDLHVKVPKSVVPDKAFIAQVRENKAAIIEYLKSLLTNEDEEQLVKKADRSKLADIPLSFSQERLWFIDQMEGSRQYHLTSVLRLKGSLNLAALEFALKTIVERHEVLRTVIKEKNGRPFQHINSAADWKLEHTANDQGLGDSAGSDQLFIALSNRPFKLDSDFMLRATLIKISNEEHALVITIHHIAADAWSLPIIIKEVTTFYKKYDSGDHTAYPLPPLQFADYAVWQRQQLSEAVLEKKLQYWRNKLNGVAPLEFPTDFNRPTVRTNNGASVKGFIPLQLSNELMQLGRQHGSSLYMVLLSAFKVILHRYSGQQDICVGASIANRSQQEIEDLIGFFVNTIAFRSQVTGNETFTELLQQVRITAMDAYQHQDVPFEKVVETVLKERDSSRSPIFQVMLVFRNTPQNPEIKIGGLTIAAEEIRQTLSKFDFTFLFPKLLKDWRL